MGSFYLNSSSKCKKRKLFLNISIKVKKFNRMYKNAAGLCSKIQIVVHSIDIWLFHYSLFNTSTYKRPKINKNIKKRKINNFMLFF